MINIDQFTKKTLQRLNDEVYPGVNSRIVEIFLCGGISNKKKLSVRDVIRRDFEKKKYIRIMYPEDMFIEMLNTDKTADLMTLENFLASNSDYICIICESAGALVELGAFTNNQSIFEKVIAIIEDKKRRKKSFIMLGPVKLIGNKNKNQVIFYNKDNLNELSNRLEAMFKIKHRTLQYKNKGSIREINSIIGLTYFIPILLYFYNTIESDILPLYLKYVFEYNNVTLKNKQFDTLYLSSLRLLFKDTFIEKQNDPRKNKKVYKLTEKGYIQVTNALYNASIPKKTTLYDNIKFGIIRRNYYE